MNPNLIFKWLRDNRVVPEEDAAQPGDGVMAFLPVEFGDPSFAECAQSSSGASSPPGDAVSATRVDITLPDGRCALSSSAFFLCGASSGKIFHRQSGPHGWNCRYIDSPPPAATDPKSDKEAASLRQLLFNLTRRCSAVILPERLRDALLRRTADFCAWLVSVSASATVRRYLTADRRWIALKLPGNFVYGKP